MSPTATPSAPAAPAAAPAAPSRFFPTDAQPALGPVVPAAPAAPAAPAPPAPALPPTVPSGPPDPRSAFFGTPASSDLPAPESPRLSASAGSPPTAAPSPDFDPASFTRQLITDLLPDTWVKSTDPGHRNFAPLRESLQKAVERATTAEMKLARAHKSTGSPAEAALREKLAASEAEVAKGKGTLEKLALLEARAELADNDAFAAEFTEKLTGLRTEADTIAKEAGVDAAILDKAFAAATKLGIAKALADIEDADAKALLADLARQALHVSAKFRAEWKDPVRALAEWRSKSAEHGAARSAHNAQQAVTLHRQAVEHALAGSESSPANFALQAMLGTPEGKAAIDAIESEYSGNSPIQPARVLADRVQAATVPHLIRYTAHLEAELQAAHSRVAALTGAQPAGHGSPSAAAGAAPPQPGSRFFQPPAGSTVLGPVVTGAMRGA